MVRAIAGYEQNYAVTQTAANGDDIIGRMEALANRSVASADDGATWLLTEGQNYNNQEIANASNWNYFGPIVSYNNPPAPWVSVDPWNGYYTGEENANFDWVSATTPADWTQGTTVANADQSRGDQEAGAEQACRVALSYGAYRLRAVRQLLKRGAEQSQRQFDFLEHHPLIRPLNDYSLSSLQAFRKERDHECRPS